MSNEEFDVIVIGAGMAGVACAGELVLRGLRPLLLCETTEVTSSLRPCIVEGNHGMLQHPVWTLAWGGGYWYPLARELNIPLQLHQSLPYAGMFYSTKSVFDIPNLVSASSLAQMLLDMAPFPVDEVRGTFEHLCYQGLGIPYQELLLMDRIPMMDWMTDQGADEIVAMMLLSLLANLLEVPVSQCRELSVLGAWGTIRSLICGEGLICAMNPDARTALAIPICNEVEKRGGAVWRSARVASVLRDGDKVTGVALEDGRQVNAPVVAIATGNPRIPKILDPLPPEAVAPIEYTSNFTQNQDFTIYSLLDKPVVPPELNRFLYVINDDGSNLQYSWPLHTFPWTTEPGKHFVGSQRNYETKDVEAAGGADAIYQAIQDVNDELYPGFKDAIVATGIQQHKHHWSAPLLIGPKLPRRVESVEGLYFVGDGSAPIGGMFVDSAASTGVLGARTIVEDRAKH